MKSRVKAAGAGKVACRLCKGDHFTAKCPYKDTLGSLENAGMFNITKGPNYCSLGVENRQLF